MGTFHSLASLKTLMPINLSAQLSVSFRKRQLLFLAATLITLLLIGYQFGTFDEAMHIPFLKSMANPALYAGDKMLTLQSIYYSYFWFFFIPFLKLGWLEPVLFIVHALTIYLSYWAIWELSDTLFHNPLTSLISVIAFIVPHFSFVGFPVFEFAPLSRTFVLPFLLIAINQFLKGRIVLAFFIAGLMYNIHVVSVNFILAMFGLACLIEFSRIGVRKIITGGLVFILAALPVLLWKASGSPIDFSLRPAWVAFLNQTMFRHIFALIGTFPGTWVIVLCGLSAIGMFFIAFQSVPKIQTDLTARNFIFAGIIVLLVDIITVYWLPVTIIIQSQISRIGLWVLILAYIFFANYLAELYKQKALSPTAFWLLMLTYLASPLPVLTVLVWLLVRFVKREKIIKFAGTFIPLATLASFIILLSLGFWQPGIFIFGQQTPWVQAQNWARMNTPENARFITPPEKIGVQESDWRVHSERASAGTFSELLVAAFQPGYEKEWETRFTLLAPGAEAQFNGDYFANIEIIRKAYESLTTKQLLSAACQLNTQYIVSEKPYTHTLPLVYENSEFAIYDVRQVGCNNNTELK